VPSLPPWNPSWKQRTVIWQLGKCNDRLNRDACIALDRLRLIAAKFESRAWWALVRTTTLLCCVNHTASSGSTCAWRLLLGVIMSVVEKLRQVVHSKQPSETWWASMSPFLVNQCNPGGNYVLLVLSGLPARCPRSSTHGMCRQILLSHQLLHGSSAKLALTGESLQHQSQPWLKLVPHEILLYQLVVPWMDSKDSSLHDETAILCEAANNWVRCFVIMLDTSNCACAPSFWTGVSSVIAIVVHAQANTRKHTWLSICMLLCMWSVSLFACRWATCPAVNAAEEAEGSAGW